MEIKYTEFTGRTVEEAVREGLKVLGLREEEADVRVLEEGKKKLFGYVKARVEIAPKTSENPLSKPQEEKSEYDAEKKAEIHRDESGRTDGERAVEFLEGLFDILKITACTELVSEGEKIEINVTAANTNAVIGKRGAMLDAIQTVAGAVANIGRDEYKRVVVDCENYREKREETLRNLARKLAQKAVKSGRKLKLEPMNPYERRIIHAALSESEEVTTQSEGKEPHRYVVIVPNDLTDPDAPAIPARDERPRRGGGGGGYRKSGYRQRDGYDKPYRRDGYKKDGYNRNNGGYRKPYDRENGNGGTNFNERKDYNKPRSSSYSKKPSSDFFGTYLGNSKDNKDDE